MKITIYELLGLIKDGKAPKKIKVYGDTFDKNEYQNDIKNIYFDDDGDTLFDDYNWDLNEEVEILPDEEDEFIDIEEINGDYVVPNTPATENEAYIMACFLAHEMVLNNLIKNQKKIIEALSNERN